ncbi:hypothetical protein CS8_090810 [Cupriavidus sp. 8B]
MVKHLSSPATSLRIHCGCAAKIFKAKRARELDFGPGDTPIEILFALRRKQAAKRRRAASDIAQVGRERQTAKPPSVCTRK